MDSKKKPLKDITAQTGAALDSLETTLKEYGVNLTSVVKVNVYVTDMDNYEVVNKIYAKRFQSPYPARTFIGVRGGGE